MPMSWALLAAILLAAAGFLVGRSRAFAAGAGDVRTLHSRPTYHGMNAALSVMLPVLTVMVLASGLRMAGVIGPEAAGVAGLLGLGAAVLARVAFDFAAATPLWSVLLGFGVSSAVGLVFGMWPALKAARQDPIEALRYE